MTEVDLERRIANWNGAQTADYGAVCSDLAQLKLNKVPVKRDVRIDISSTLVALNSQGFMCCMLQTALIPSVTVLIICIISMLMLLPGSGRCGRSSAAISKGSCSHGHSPYPGRNKQSFRR